MTILIFFAVLLVYWIIEPFIESLLYAILSLGIPSGDMLTIANTTIMAILGIAVWVFAFWVCLKWEEHRDKRDADSETPVQRSGVKRMISGCVLLALQLLSTYGNFRARNVSYTVPTSLAQLAYDTIFFIFANWVGILGAILLASGVSAYRKGMESAPAQPDPFDSASLIPVPPLAESPAEQEPTIADPASPAPTTPKLRFCKLCGSPIDPTTRKCTGCGKQYFRPPVFRKKHFAIAAGVLACIAAVFLVSNLVSRLNAAEARVDELSAQISELNTELAVQKDLANKYSKAASSYSSSLGALQKEYDELRKENTTMGYKLDFFNEHIVFIPDDGNNTYHIHGCPYSDLFSHSFYAYNTENAIYKGYKPCPHCCG